MKKFLLTTLLVLVTVVAAFAETVSVNTNSSSKPPYTLKSGSQDIVNITTEKGTATSDISYNKTTQMVMYSGNILKFSMVGDYVLKEVVIACSSPQYAIQTTAKWDVEGGTASLSSENYTWTAPASANVSAASLTMDGTYRLKTITITYAVKAGPVDANATFEETIETTYDPENPTLKLTYTPEDLFENGATVTYDISQAEGAVDENLNILKAVDLGVVKVKWTGSSKYNDGESKDIYFTIHKAEAALGYSAETATATMGETATLPTLTNPYNLKLRYSSSKRAVADIDDNTGAVTIVAPGTATIGAFFDGNELFKAGSATYTLTVQEAGLPATPEFSFTDEGTYKIDQKLAITTATEDAEIYYSFDGDNYIKYEGEISFDKAGAYTVFAYAKNAKGQSTTAEILFTIEKYTHSYEFSNATELELGTDRIFIPALADLPEGVTVEYKVTKEDGTSANDILVADPELKHKDTYFIINTGTFKVTAAIAETDTHATFSKDLTVTVKEQTSTKIVTATIDFTKAGEMGFTEPTTGNGFDIPNNTEYKSGNITMLFNASGNQARIWNYNGTLELRMYSGNKWTVKVPESSIIESVEMYFTEGGSDANNLNATDGKQTIGTFTTINNKNTPRIWSPNGTSTNQIIFSTTAKPKVAKAIIKYSIACDPATTYTLAFDNEDGYELEVGDKLPVVNVPEGYTATYVLNGKKVDNPETFVFTEDIENAELYAYAFTGKDDKYLPAVAYAIADVKPIILPGHLTIHYSNADGFSMASFATVDEGTENEYVFNDIEVTGYDSADGHYYGHVFFSFYKPAEAAGAPRRAAEEEDWSAVNDLVTYTPAEHLTVAQPGSSDALTLVRNKANTFTGLPNSFRVPSSHETGNAVNFTVKLTENGTPATMTVASGIQTGVESVGVDADGEAEYYTLQGVRVAKPAAGIYLRRQGGTVSKVLVK